MDAKLLEWPLYGGTLLQWLVALGVTLGIVLAVRIAMPFLVARLEALSKRTHLVIDDALVHALRTTRNWLVALVAIAAGSQALELPEGAGKLVRGVATIALFVQAGLWLGSLLQFWLKRSEQKALLTSPGAVTSLAAVGFIGRIVLWALILLPILDNLGINVTTLIAGLGIGGVAVALAVQNILGDLFASLSIVIDKPFVVGDFIIVDTYMGTVEHVGLKTTRIRSLDGEQIVFSNSDLLKTRLRNYKRMRERRVVFPFKVRYDTKPEQLERIPTIVRRLVESHKQARFERSHFLRFGDGSFDFETVFWMTTPDYNTYMDVQQQLNLDLMRELERVGVRFALPARLTITEEMKVVDAPEHERESAPAKGRVTHQ
jgi:small-conductance mechanosensitive channel